MAKYKLTKTQKRYEGATLCEDCSDGHGMPEGSCKVVPMPKDGEVVQCETCTTRTLRSYGAL
jgi:hypothetical protein